MRIGLHTGEIQLRDEGNYIGPTINRTARLRDLAHGGQTVISGATEPLVIDWLPDRPGWSIWERYPLRDFPRPERVAQLCHPDLPKISRRSESPMLPHPKSFPVQLTSFVGRDNCRSPSSQPTSRQQSTGHADWCRRCGKDAAGAGSCRPYGRRFSLTGHGMSTCRPITDPDLVPVAVARALGLPDQPGRSTMDTIVKFDRRARALVVLDNCEHLLDACAELIQTLLGTCPNVTLLATSREPIGLAGEVTWRVPSLSLVDEAVVLFTDRARLARPEFVVAEDNSAA